MDFKKSFEFEWDKGNNEKPKKHGLTLGETEETFFDKNKVTFKDILHSGREERFRILGKTKKGKLLFVVFTKRNSKIRVVTARRINKKEVYLYEKKVSSSKI